MITFMAIGEVAEWLKERGLLGPKLHPLVEEVDCSRLLELRRFDVVGAPDCYLAELLAGFFKSDEEVLLYIDDWGPQQDEVGMNILDRFRQALGEPAKVWDKPGHVFRGKHLEMESLLRLVLALYWDVYFVSSSGKLVVSVWDADSVCSLYAADPELLDTEVLKRLDELIASRPDTNLM